MKISALFSGALLALAGLPVYGREYRPNGPPTFAIGSDLPQPTDTVGYMSQHVSLIVSNFENSVKFYRDTLGMRTVFELKWDVYKVGYYTYGGGGGVNAKDETGPELYGQQTNLRGSFELQWYRGAKRPKPESCATMSHFGIAVPNMASFVARMKAAGVKFLKTPGSPPSNKIGQYYGFDAGAFPQWFKDVIPLSYAFILDPDGYLIEVSPMSDEAPPPPPTAREMVRA